jgi:hypothetical protein
MGAQEILHPEFPKFAGGPYQVFILKLKKMKPSNHGVHRRSPDLRASIFESVDDSCMAATQ